MHWVGFLLGWLTKGEACVAKSWLDSLPVFAECKIGLGVGRQILSMKCLQRQLTENCYQADGLFICPICGLS